MKRIVITGIGTISSYGTGVNAFWDALLEGKTKVAPVASFDTSALNSHRAAEIGTVDSVDIPRQKVAGNIPRSIQLGIVAAHLALQHAGVELSNVDPSRAGVVYGTGYALRTLTEFYDRVLKEGPRSAD